MHEVPRAVAADRGRVGPAAKHGDVPDAEVISQPEQEFALLDRRWERVAIDRVLDAVRGGLSGTLILRGGIGVGKTTLLRYAIDAARDLRVSSIAGVESEISMGFGGLHQLLLPFLPLLDELPPPQQSALRVAFGQQAGAQPEQFLVGLAALTLLSLAAEDQPLLCVIDDWHWLDRESAHVLGFVARRLYADRVGVIGAIGELVPSQAAELQLPVVDVEGLPDAEARDLLASVAGGALTAQAVDRILADTRNNPLALVELATEYTADQEGERSQLWRAAVRAGIDPETASAETAWAGVLQFPGNSVRFRYPLLRSAVYHGANAADRRRAHRSNGMLLAYRGNLAEARATGLAQVRESVDRGQGGPADIGRYIVAMADLFGGDYATAMSSALTVFENDLVYTAEGTLPELIEAAVRAGEREVAATAYEALSQRALAAGTPWGLGLRARCAALLAEGAGAEDSYRESISQLERCQMVLDLARAHLLYGQWLRRAKRRRGARAELRIAYDMFTRLGAERFADQAAAELRAAGEHALARTPKTPADLTSQEARIADLVAAGASNSEIAAQLFISPSTVDYHLRKVFRKLAVTSRTQLVGRLKSGQDAASRP